MTFFVFMLFSTLHAVYLARRDGGWCRQLRLWPARVWFNYGLYYALPVWGGWQGGTTIPYYVSLQLVERRESDVDTGQST